MKDEASTSRADEPAPDPPKPDGSTSISPQPQPETPAVEVGWDQSPTVLSTEPAPRLPAPEARQRISEELVGTRLGDYHLEAFVGGGGMGAVFRALDQRLNRVVAIKVLTGDIRHGNDVKKRFENEAQSAARLNHENIARIYDVGEDQGWKFIVFEFLEGTNLRDLVTQHGVLPVETAIHYTREIAHALAHAAMRDVVHRDIKPSNILISPEGRAKLVDMGLARIHDMLSHEDDLTASGVTLGTFDYISPEQARDPRQVDLRSDIYSLGCTLYFMLTGRPPFPDGTVLQKLLSHSTDEPTDPGTMRPDIPVGVLHVLNRMIAKDPAQRYQHPEELISDLAALQHGLQPAEPTARRIAVRWRAHLPWISAATLLAITIVTADAFLPRIGRGPEAIRSFQSGRRANTLRGPSANAPPALGEPREPPPETAPSVPPADRGAADLTAPNGSLVATSPDTPSDPRRGNAPEGVSLGATLTGTEAAPPLPTSVEASRVIVTTVPYLDDGLHTVATLQEALAYCREHPQVTRIELEVSGKSSQSAVQIQGLDVTIAAAEGHRPTLVFDQVVANAQPIIDVEDGQVHFENVHLLWRVPRQVESPGGFFRLNNASLSARHCTLSVHNERYAGRSAYHEDLCVFTSARQQDRAATTGDDSHVNLQDCVVRGEVSLLQLSDRVAMNFIWRNGVMIVTDTMFLYKQLSEQKRSLASHTLQLENVAVNCGRGVGHVVTGSYAVDAPTVSLQTEHCIFFLPPIHALFTHEGNLEMGDYQRSFSYQGNNNVYLGEGLFWVIIAHGTDSLFSTDWIEWQSYWNEHRAGVDHAAVRRESSRRLATNVPLHDTSAFAVRALLPEITGETQEQSPGPLFDALPSEDATEF